jgi:hypothetical protein
MNTLEVLQLTCPHCQSPMEAPVEYAGRQLICVHCRAGFVAPAPEPPPGARSDPEPTPEEIAAERRARTSKELWDKAESYDGFANAALVFGTGAFLIGILMLMNAPSTGATISLAAGAGLGSLGLTCKIIAQLIHIRAELRSKK